MDEMTSTNRDIDLKQVLADMARAVVDDPASVLVTEKEDEDGLVLVLNVAENDMGMSIGKRGKIAHALRTVIKAAAKITNQKVTVEIK